MSLDVIELIAIAAACLWTRQALLVLALHVGAMLLAHLVLGTGAFYFFAVAALYAVGATLNIKILPTIRWMLFAIGVVNWMAAVDFLVTPEITWFYSVYPAITNGIDGAVLLLLWGQGGVSVIGFFIAMGHSRALSLFAHSLRHRDPSEG